MAKHCVGFCCCNFKGRAFDGRFGRRHTGTIFFRLPYCPDGNCTWAGRRKRLLLLLQQREAQHKRRGAVVAYTDSENSTKTPAPKKQSFDRIDSNDLWNETTYKNARPHVEKVVARPKQCLLYANFKKWPLIGPNCGFKCFMYVGRLGRKNILVLAFSKGLREEVFSCGKWGKRSEIGTDVFLWRDRSSLNCTNAVGEKKK